MPPTLRIASEADTDLLLGFMCEYYAFDGPMLKKPGVWDQASEAALTLRESGRYTLTIGISPFVRWSCDVFVGRNCG